jgi:SAM-dependent methyltransferase
MASELQTYLEDEWLIFARDPTRQQDALRAVAGIAVRRALDIGCGGGQDLIPFAVAGSHAVGVDIARDTIAWAHDRFGSTLPDLPVTFATGAAEALPFGDGTFDVILCRVTIPYTDNRKALSEMARVLRPGGAILLRTHRPRYYVDKIRAGIKMRSPLFAVHAVRVLLSGSIYRMTGWQPNGGWLLKETFLTTGMLERELTALGLHIDRELDDSVALAGSYRIRKPATA